MAYNVAIEDIFTGQAYKREATEEEWTPKVKPLNGSHLSLITVTPVIDLGGKVRFLVRDGHMRITVIRNNNKDKNFPQTTHVGVEFVEAPESEKPKPVNLGTGTI